MKEIKVSILFFLFIAFFSSFLMSQEGRGQARLKGVVVDKEGNPVEGAKVELESLVHELTMTTKTNEKGIWSFIGLGRTVVRIKASKEGYDPTIIPELEVSAIKNPDQEIVLKKITDVERLERESPKELYLKGEKLYNQEEYEKALDVFKEFVEKQPDLYEARVSMGNCYIKLKQYDKAIQEFEFVLDKLEEEKEDLKGNETAASIYASLGELYMDKNDFDRAKDYFEKSIDIDPSDHALSYNVAEILFNSNKIDEAIQYYQLTAEIKPDWPNSYLKLGYCYLNKGEMRKAIDYLNKFVELSPQDDPQVNAVKNLIKQLEKK
ncbi:MAG: tetratricopeptide repeat protein [Candidatus Aminicenantes bacterium]